VIGEQGDLVAMISLRLGEGAIRVAIMRSWGPLRRTILLGVVGSAVLFVAKANPADAPDQKAPASSVNTANLSNQWAEERRVESGRVDIRRELMSEIRDEISGILNARFNSVKKNRLDAAAKLTENGNTAQSIDRFKDLAALVYYYSPEAIDAQSRIGSWEKKARQKLAFLQTTDDPTTDSIKSLSEIVKSVSAEGDLSVANCYSSKNVNQDSSGNFIFKDVDAAKAWLSECVAAINNFNDNAESDPMIKIKQKSEEIIANLDLENRRSKDKIDTLDRQIRDELTRASASGGIAGYVLGSSKKT
jgi:hypothetical protein